MARDVWVVTGGGGGLGEQIAIAAGHSGQTVVVADADGGAADRVATTLGDRGISVTADLRQPDDVRRVVRTATGAGPLRCWVNCAGAWSPGSQFPEGEGWRSTLALDLETPMLATQLCLEPMGTTGGGAVVNVSSSAALGDAAYASPEYAAAKAGLVRFTTAVSGLADEIGVRVSCVVPHWIGLPRAYDEWSRMTPDERSMTGGIVPVGEVVETVLALAADPSSGGRVVELRGRPVG